MIYLLIPWVNNCILYVCTVYFKHKHPGRGSATASGQDDISRHNAAWAHTEIVDGPTRILWMGRHNYCMAHKLQHLVLPQESAQAKVFARICN